MVEIENQESSRKGLRNIYIGLASLLIVGLSFWTGVIVQANKQALFIRADFNGVDSTKRAVQDSILLASGFDFSVFETDSGAYISEDTSESSTLLAMASNTSTSDTIIKSIDTVTRIVDGTLASNGTNTSVKTSSKQSREGMKRNALEERKKELRKMIKNINLTYDYKNTLMGSNLIKGKVENNTDKELTSLTVSVNYYSKDDQIIGRENVKLQGAISPNGTLSFKEKVCPPQYAKSVVAYVVYAQ